MMDGEKNRCRRALSSFVSPDKLSHPVSLVVFENHVLACCSGTASNWPIGLKAGITVDVHLASYYVEYQKVRFLYICFRFVVI